MIQLDKILMPTDLSDYARHSVPYAVELARTYGATLDLVHVLEPQWARSMGVTEFPATADYSEIAEIEAMNALEHLRADLDYAPVETHLLKGAPHVALVQHARNRQTDLIVLATHGRTGLKHALIGSVAEKIVQMAPCPVLTIKHPEHEFVLP